MLKSSLIGLVICQFCLYCVCCSTSLREVTVCGCFVFMCVLMLLLRRRSHSKDDETEDDVNNGRRNFRLLRQQQ